MRASGPTISLVVISKNIDSAFKYMQAAESLARLLPPGSKNAFVTDESVASVDLQSLAGVSRQVEECEAWAKEVYGKLSNHVRDGIYASAKNRLEQLRPSR
ncbi:hypothetical protein AVXHC19_14060 [Acidovorax sacchari]